MMNAARGAGTAYPSTVPESTPVFSVLLDL
jgi:hypothetical protein